MLNKKYILRHDLKVLGLENLKFTRNRSLKKIYLSADYRSEIGKTDYLITFDVSLDEFRNTKLDMVNLCREMLNTFENFKAMKTTEQKKYAEEHGRKLINE